MHPADRDGDQAPADAGEGPVNAVIVVTIEPLAAEDEP
jgi:hypothetical protein